MSTKQSFISYGGGVQSTAMLVLAAQGKISAKIAIFANVGNDSEHPATLSYLEQHAHPFAKNNGLEIVEVQYQKQGKPFTLWQSVMETDSSFIKMPVFLKQGAPSLRSCTSNWKVKTIESYLKKRYGLKKYEHVDLLLGISTDEVFRINRNKMYSFFTNPVYPLIDLNISRDDCIRIIHNAGLPVPPKSSCFFCPFKAKSEWQTMRREEPELFSRAIQLEKKMNENLKKAKKEAAYLSSWRIPLTEIPDSVETQKELFDFSCDSGHCMT